MSQAVNCSSKVQLNIHKILILGVDAEPRNLDANWTFCAVKPYQPIPAIHRPQTRGPGVWLCGLIFIKNCKVDTYSIHVG